MSRWRRSFASVVDDQSDDIWGLVFLILALLGILSIYVAVIGLAGRLVRTGSADLFGLASYVLPVASGVQGVYLLSRHQRSQPGRVAVGLGVALAALSGLFNVLLGRATVHEPLKALGRAGGLLGAAEGTALRAGLANWGAGLVLGAALVLALLIITATPVRVVASGARLSFASGARALRWSWLRTAGALSAAWRRAEMEGSGEAGKLRAGARRIEAGATARSKGEVDEADVAGGGVAGGGVAGGGVAGGGVAGGGVAGGGVAGGGVAGGGVAGGGVVIPIMGLASAPRAEQLAIDLGLSEQASPPWRLPPLSLLRRSKHAEVDRHQVEVLGHTLEGALAAHGVETRLVGATVGPSVTRYELELGPGVKVQRVTSLQRDIAYAMASAEVRILAPIPGRSAIGVEVPNRQRQIVTLGDILSSPEAAAARHPLEVAAGRDIAGRPVLVNLAEMPHLLIAGATGSGKSSCINSMLTSVLMRATPDQVRLILVDPKRVELGAYAGLPHLLTAVVTNPKKAANALRWAVQEMERRYDLLAEVGMRDITGYNAAYDRGELRDLEGDIGAGAEPLDADEPLDAGDDAGGAEKLGYLEWVERRRVVDPVAPTKPGNTATAESAVTGRLERLPFILVVVDELNDLMMVAARDVEESICRIAQMARAVGIHLVLATQRPSVDVITGLIKANVPSRLAFAVSSLADSRVVLDQPGAERLIGKGDMLLLTASSSLARRLQGPWVDEDDVRKVVGNWRRQSSPRYVEGVEGPEGGPGAQGEEGGGDDDGLLESAMELVVRSQLGSTSMLQRKLRVGFARAGRLMDLLEQRGVVGPSEGSKARSVLMTVDELEDRGL